MKFSVKPCFWNITAIDESRSGTRYIGSIFCTYVILALRAGFSNFLIQYFNTYSIRMNRN